MCGLFSQISRKPIDGQKFFNGLSAIEHRGPDGLASWKKEEGGQYIQLGHSRLSIIDLAGGQQPLTNEDESLVATVNGEFYDYKRIRDHLKARGCKFKTESDSEILIHLYQEYGTEMFKWLRGEFAFILYDRRNNLILSARDRFGIKPLHYYQNKDSLFFCSEAKSLKKYGLDLKPNIDYFMGNFTSPLFGHQQTAFAGVKHLDPGYYYIYKNGNLNKYQYWDINSTHKQKISHDDAIEAYSEKFKEAVELRLVADVPVASYLSGGIDSSAVFSIASKELGYDIKPFCISFTHKDYDETALARKVAESAGQTLSTVNVGRDEIADNLEKAVYHSERFHINGHSTAKFLLSRLLNKSGFKVALTGEGSDESLGGYLHFIKDLLAGERHESEFQEMVKRSPRSQGLVLGESSNDYSPEEKEVFKTFGFVPSFVRIRRDAIKAQQALLKSELKQDFNIPDFVAKQLLELNPAANIKKWAPIDISLYLWRKTVFPDYILSILGDRMEMANSIECRTPFLDHHLVDFCASLPTEMYYQKLKDKYVLRQAVKNYVPKEVLQEQKQPFAFPVEYKKDRLSEMALDAISSEGFKKLNIYDPKAMEGFKDHFVSSSNEVKASIDPLLYVFLSIDVLGREFF